jgi:hypothetical protein
MYSHTEAARVHSPCLESGRERELEGDRSAEVEADLNKGIEAGVDLSEDVDPEQDEGLAGEDDFLRGKTRQSVVRANRDAQELTMIILSRILTNRSIFPVIFPVPPTITLIPSTQALTLTTITARMGLQSHCGSWEHLSRWTDVSGGRKQG